MIYSPFLIAAFDITDKRVLLLTGLAMILAALLWKVKRKVGDMRKDAQLIADEAKLYELNFMAGFLDAFARDDEIEMFQKVKTAVDGLRDDGVRMDTLRKVQNAATRRLWEKGTVEDRAKMLQQMARLDVDKQFVEAVKIKQPTATVEAPE